MSFIENYNYKLLREKKFKSIAILTAVLSSQVIAAGSNILSEENFYSITAYNKQNQPYQLSMKEDKFFGFLEKERLQQNLSQEKAQFIREGLKDIILRSHKHLTKIESWYSLAQMDLLGEGVARPDYAAAFEKFSYVCCSLNNGNEIREKSFSYIQQMRQNGHIYIDFK